MIERATDAILLKRFAEEREEAAFAELVERHGPLVRGVCRRLLRSEHDVEDVFQATFLLLALRASDVAWRASIGGWVRDVARRLALNARTEIARRRRRETPVSNLLPGLRFGETGALPDRACPLSVFTDEVERRDVRRVIDGEVDDLPEKYREPLVLCYLEGKTNHEAAAALGYPVGSMSRRLEKARGLLRKRLIGRGVTLGVVLALVGWLVATSPRPGGRPDPGPGSPPSASRPRRSSRRVGRNFENFSRLSNVMMGMASAGIGSDSRSGTPPKPPNSPRPRAGSGCSDSRPRPGWRRSTCRGSAPTTTGPTSRDSLRRACAATSRSTDRPARRPRRGCSPVGALV